jgi:hypothetical protein
MTAEIKAALEGAPEFVAFAVEQLASSLGDTDPMVVAGRRVMTELDAIPEGAVWVTEETLAAAIHRAWPFRRNTPSTLGLSAALLIAALRTER